MARRVDRANLLEAEVPLGVRGRGTARRRRRSPPSTWSGTSSPALVLEAHEQVVDADDVVGMPGERGAEDGGHADRVLVEVGFHVLGPDRVLVALERDDSRLDVEVAAELLPHHVHVAAEDEVRAARVLARLLAASAPLPLQRERAEHDRLRRTLRARAGRLARRVEEVGEHADAALLDLGGLRVLGVVDEVAVEVLGDDPLRLGLHPGGHEGGQVAHRDPVEHQLLADQPHGVDGGHAVLRQLVVGCRLEQEAVAELVGQVLELMAQLDLDRVADVLVNASGRRASGHAESPRAGGAEASGRRRRSRPRRARWSSWRRPGRGSSRSTAPRRTRSPRSRRTRSRRG